MKSKKQNSKKNLKSKKQKSKKQMKSKKQQKTKKQLQNSITNPVILYSSKTPNSEEILEEINDKNVKTTIYKAESKIPLTIIEKPDGSMIMSMRQKRNMVIQSYRQH